mmetsp:Transcript_12394/g.21221  ORF Transcript_12394/g.21221 Transcript_12394/m.21221 type:complete len:306 (+) Transcript_12394:3-920(+)
MAGSVASEDESPTELERLVLLTLRAADEDEDRESPDAAEEEEEEDNIAEEDEELTLVTYLAASLEEAIEEQKTSGEGLPQDIADWIVKAQEWLADSDPEVADKINAKPDSVLTLAEGLFSQFVLGADADNVKSKFGVGDHVLAILDQDDEWHPAKVESVQVIEGLSKAQYTVRFKEYGNVQPSTEARMALDKDCYESALEDNQCCLCTRPLKLTFHHLVPRETHSALLKKNKFPDALEKVYQDTRSGLARKEWLHVHGVNICRACHSQVHRLESNMSLALEYHSQAKLFAHPGLRRWRAFATKQK